METFGSKPLLAVAKEEFVLLNSRAKKSKFFFKYMLCANIQEL
jgi:hypothetical protein